jgi:hypothetical protein
MTPSYLPLHALYQEQMSPRDLSSPLNREIHSFLKGESVNINGLIQEEEKRIEDWKDLLVVNLLIYITSSKTAFSSAIIAKIRSLLHRNWNQHSQYIRTLIALNQCLADMPVPSISPHILEGGAAPIAVQEYAPWLALPYAPLHAELGVWMGWLACLTQDEALKRIVVQMAKWQVHTLDGRYCPFEGLFAQEPIGHLHQQLTWNYLFFLMTAQFFGEASFHFLAQQQLKHLQQISQPLHLPPLALLFEQIVSKPEEGEWEDFILSSRIYDPQTALVGQRQPHFSVACTLQGGNTGMGCWCADGCGIVSFGPQHLPLGDCQGFGIEGNYLTNRGARYSSIELSEQGFLLKGCARLVDQPSYSTSPYFQLGKFKGIWLETEQELKEKSFRVSTTFLGFDGWDNVAFSFFVKGEHCQVEGDRILYPCTFDRYQGPIRPLRIGSQQTSFYLSALHGYGHLQVIPLSGKESFWGATFLVAYLLDNKQRKYQWQMQLA